MQKKIEKNGKARSLTVTFAVASFILSVAILLANGGLAFYTNYLNIRETITVRQYALAQSASHTVTDFIEQKFAGLETAVGFSNPVSAGAAGREDTMDGLLGIHPAFRQIALVDRQGRLIAEVSRVSQSLSPQFMLELTGDALNQTADGLRYVSPVYIDDVTSEPMIALSVPVTNPVGEYQGTLVAEVNLKFMWELVDHLQAGETGYAYVVDAQGNLIAFGDTTRVLAGENARNVEEVKKFVEHPSSQVTVPTDVKAYKGLMGSSVLGVYYPLGMPEWAVVVEIPTAEAYQPVAQNLIYAAFTMLVMAFLAGVAGVFMARRLTVPLLDLSATAVEISNGNLQAQARVASTDEIGQLATAFNAMTAKLARRASELATVAKVSTDATQTTDTATLLQQVTDQTRDAFHLYHAHIYLLDDDGDSLVLTSGAGEVGRQMAAEKRSIPLNREQSLVARAARTRQGVIVNDVQADPGFLPNPLLPNTRSEMAVPMIVGDRLIGVFDVQADDVNRFSEEDVSIHTTLAAQVAGALQNARQYEQTRVTASLLQTTLEATADGILVIDPQGKVESYNRRFLDLWQIPAEIAESQDDNKLLGHVLSQLKEPDTFIAGVQALYAKPDASSFDELEFNDGRIFERYSQPQRVGNDILGRVWSFRDVTERRRMEHNAQQRAARQEALNRITQKIQNSSSIPQAIQIAARELGHALGEKPTLVTIDPQGLSGGHRDH